MKILAHNRLGEVIEQEVTRVAVYDDHDNLVAFVFKYAPGHIHPCHLKDPEWLQILSMFGLDRENKVVVTELAVATNKS